MWDQEYDDFSRAEIGQGKCPAGPTDITKLVENPDKLVGGGGGGGGGGGYQGWIQESEEGVLHMYFLKATQSLMTHLLHGRDAHSWVKFG